MKRNYLQAVTWTIPLTFVLFYALWPLLGLPRFYYAPQTREIFWHKIEGIVLTGWYGRLAMAGLTGVVLGALLALAVMPLPASRQKTGPWIAVAAVLAAMIITAIQEIRHWML
ncbi:MAG: hypothetical protein JSV03_04545 [Planctomycetota bacterium]|nr:MAG: hypothetical protein JSV03_04545 [Planctomycetota bacterium]